MSEDKESAPPGIPHFDEMVDLQKWQEVEEFYRGADDLVARDVREAVDLRRRLREELLESDPRVVEKIRRPTPEAVAWAKEQLFGGRVCGVDGTLSRSPSLSGGRARIGVAATTYQGDKIQRVLYVSYRRMAGAVTSAMEYFERLKRVNKISELLLRAVMAFSERSLALQRGEEWKLVHGELLPYELWAALGTGRPLRTRLDLARRLVQAKKIVGVVEGSKNVELLNAGELLGPGEYLDARELRVDLMEYLRGKSGDVRAAHFNKQEEQEFEEFSSRYGPEVRVGLFKAGSKTYLFHAHKDVFDDAAAIVLADASHQPMRGFPLLLDYADQLLRHYLAQSDFDQQIQFKTARLGMEVLAAEIDPRKTRR